MADEPEDDQTADEHEADHPSEETPRLNWGSAEVSDGTLTVGVSGDLSKPWRGVFERTVKLLRGGDWDEVELESGEVRVTGVQEGVEESLRHFLEGAVQEANATLAGGHDEHGEDAGKDRGEDEADDGEADDGDSRMTERFREFGS